MSELIKFLELVMPSLVRFGAELFEFHQGDAQKAKANIEERREQIEAHRRARDAELARKYKGPERRKV